MWCETLELDIGHQSEQHLTAYKKVAKNRKFYIREKSSVVFFCNTKEVFKTKYESCSPISFLAKFFNMCFKRILFC